MAQYYVMQQEVRRFAAEIGVSALLCILNAGEGSTIVEVDGKKWKVTVQKYTGKDQQPCNDKEQTSKVL